jgi:hypothetical protein
LGPQDPPESGGKIRGGGIKAAPYIEGIFIQIDIKVILPKDRRLRLPVLQFRGLEDTGAKQTEEGAKKKNRTP